MNFHWDFNFLKLSHIITNMPKVKINEGFYLKK